MMMARHRQGRSLFAGTLLVTFLLLGLTQTVGADMSLTEANKTYPVRFQDWVYVYLNNEFIQASVGVPDYSVEMRTKVISEKVRFVITGYYFDTKLGNDWYRQYGSQLESKIALLCHTWTQQGYPISPDDFEIHIEKEKMGR